MLRPKSSAKWIMTEMDEYQNRYPVRNLDYGVIFFIRLYEFIRMCCSNRCDVLFVSTSNSHRVKNKTYCICICYFDSRFIYTSITAGAVLSAMSV